MRPIACRRSIRSAIGGCVANSLSTTPGLSGSAIHRWAIELFWRRSGRPYASSLPRALARASGCLVVSALVASARYSHWTERYLDTPQDNESGYLESSPLTHAANLKDRLLIVHGLADDNVHPQNTVVMSDALIKAKIPFEQAFYPGQKHAFGATSMRHFFERMEEFFERTLQEVVVEGVEVR